MSHQKIKVLNLNVAFMYLPWQKLKIRVRLISKWGILYFKAKIFFFFFSFRFQAFYHFEVEHSFRRKFFFFLFLTWKKKRKEKKKKKGCFRFKIEVICKATTMAAWLNNCQWHYGCVILRWITGRHILQVKIWRIIAL